MKVPQRTDRRSSSIPLQKRFGQHHLMDGAICRPLIDFLEPENRLVVEIGPGGGALTQRLVAAGGRVLAVEIDIPWAMSLSREIRSLSAQVVIGDATEISWRHYPRGTLVTGNLPFNVSTVLIERLLPQWQTVPRAAFLVQKEVGDRLVARPGDEAYGGLSVVTAARARVSKLGKIKRGSFRPPPKVDGVFVGLELLEPPLGEERMAGFNSTVRLSFSQRRKQLRNSLASGWGRAVAMQALADAGIDPRSRAEELSLEKFVELHTAYRAVVPQ